MGGVVPEGDFEFGINAEIIILASAKKKPHMSIPVATFF